MDQVRGEISEVVRLIHEVVKMQADLSARMDRSEKHAEEAHRRLLERMDRAEKENREAHKQFMKDMAVLSKRINGEAKVPPPEASGTLGVD